MQVCLLRRSVLLKLPVIGLFVSSLAFVACRDQPGPEQGEPSPSGPLATPAVATSQFVLPSDVGISAPDHDGVWSYDSTTGVLEELPIPLPDTQPSALSADGSSVMIRQSVDLLVVTITGQQHAVDRQAAGAEPTDWARDGKRVLVVGSKGLTELNLDTGDVRLLLEGDIQDAIWSPDERRVAYVQNQRLGVLDLDTGKSGIIVPDLVAKYLPDSYGRGNLAWSPDGGQIAFANWTMEDPVTQGRSDIYLVRPDGSGLTRITDSPRAKLYFSFSPDGASLAFVHSQNDGDRLGVVRIGDRSLWFADTRGVAGSNPPPWVSNDAVLVALLGDIALVKSDGTVHPLFGPERRCFLFLIGYAQPRIVFGSACDRGGA